MKNDTLLEKLAHLKCKYCNGKNFNIYLGYALEKVFLMISCTNETCLEKQEFHLEGDDSTISVGEIFNITGQNYDLPELEETDIVEDSSVLN